MQSCIFNVLKKLISNPLAQKYSFAGAKGKKAFQDLILYRIILSKCCTVIDFCELNYFLIMLTYKHSNLLLMY